MRKGQFLERVERSCKCGKTFYIREKRLVGNRGKYCSKECKYEYRKRPSGLIYRNSGKNKFNNVYKKINHRTEDGNFYVYAYLDPRKIGEYNFDEINSNFEPFYIGIGQGDRKDSHLRFVKKRKYKNCYKYDKINSILQDGFLPIIRVIKLFTKRSEANAYEIHLIDIIGRHDFGKGPLTNLTNGGDGTHGQIPWNKGKKGLLPNVTIESIKTKLRKHYLFLLNGEVIVNIDNLHQYCIDMKLNKSYMYKVNNGKIDDYKGHTRII